MTAGPFTAEHLDPLTARDTPTVCDGVEIAAPARRAIGFATEPLAAIDQKRPPIAGLRGSGKID
jgi:hypothetical protein